MERCDEQFRIDIGYEAFRRCLEMRVECGTIRAELIRNYIADGIHQFFVALARRCEDEIE